jgi:hypothetical protein
MPQAENVPGQSLKEIGLVRVAEGDCGRAASASGLAPLAQVAQRNLRRGHQLRTYLDNL